MKRESNTFGSLILACMQTQAPLVTFLILLAVSAICFPAMLAADNIANVASQVSMIGVVSIGMAFVILAGGIDLSVGSIAVVAAMVAASFSETVGLAVLLPILVGVGLGACNGVMVTQMRIPPFIATLAAMLGIRGVAFIIAGEEAVVVGASTGWFSRIAWGWRGGIPPLAIIFLLVLAAAVVVSRWTSFGRSVYAVGGNEEAAGMMGLRVNRCKMLVYTICGGCAGLAGMMFASRITSVKPGDAAGWELEAIAAVVISGTSLNGGIGKMSHVIYGVLILGLINNLINKLPWAMPTYAYLLITGTLLLAVVLLQERLAKSNSR